MEERDQMWREELNKNEEAYWNGQKERDDSLARMLEEKIKETMVPWLLGIKHG